MLTFFHKEGNDLKINNIPINKNYELNIGYKDFEEIGFHSIFRKVIN